MKESTKPRAPRAKRQRGPIVTRHELVVRVTDDDSRREIVRSVARRVLDEDREALDLLEAYDRDEMTLAERKVE